MKISGIDKDFVDIIEYLNENGYKTFASCDGVLEHHADDIVVPSSAYISFLKSPKIIDLMAQFAKDKDKFIINIANNTYKEPYYLYGNIISGNRYGVYFKNEKGELTQYFKDIIEGKIVIQDTENERKNLKKLENVLEDENTNLNFSVTLNGEYEPGMLKKTGKINSLAISTKDDVGYDYDIETLVGKLSKKYGTVYKEDAFSDEFPEKEFVYVKSFYNDCEIYFTDEHFDNIIDQINYIKSIEHELPVISKDMLNDFGIIKFVEEKDDNNKKFNKDDVKDLAESRNISKIKQIYTRLKEDFIKQKNKVIGKIKEGFSRDE